MKLNRRDFLQTAATAAAAALHLPARRSRQNVKLFLREPLCPNRYGFFPDYVYRETRRNGMTTIYSGIGFDVPGSPPEAGAGGILVSREYEEMRIPNLRAVGRAVK